MDGVHHQGTKVLKKPGVITITVITKRYRKATIQLLTVLTMGSRIIRNGVT